MFLGSVTHGLWWIDAKPWQTYQFDSFATNINFRCIVPDDWTKVHFVQYLFVEPQAVKVEEGPSTEAFVAEERDLT